MRHFVFVTTEGTTFQPGEDFIGEDIENAQVLGWASGKDQKEAFNNLLKENDWLLATTFNDVVIYELMNRQIAGYGSIHSNSIS